MIKLKQFLLFIALIPEISFWVVPHDTQLLFPIIGLIGFIFIFLTTKIKLDFLSLLLVFFTFLSLIIVNYNDFQVSNFSTLLIPFIVFTNYIFLKYNSNVITLRFINTVVLFYLFGSLLQTFFPLIYFNLVHSFMYEVRWEISGEGGRGNNSFCIEPSHMAIIGVVLYLIAKNVKDSYIHNSKNIVFNTIVLNIFILESLTRSVYSFLFFILFIFDIFKYFKNRSIIYFPVLILIVFLIFLFLTSGDSRISTFLVDSISNPLLFISDQSMAYRLNGWFYSVYALIYYPFGTFNFSFVSELINPYFSTSFINYVFPVEIHNFLSNSMTGDLTGITSFFLRMGSFFWFIFLSMLLYIFRKSKTTGIVFFFYLLNITIYSSPIWMLLALLNSRKRYFK